MRIHQRCLLHIRNATEKDMYLPTVIIFRRSYTRVCWMKYLILLTLIGLLGPIIYHCVFQMGVPVPLETIRWMSAGTKQYTILLYGTPLDLEEYYPSGVKIYSGEPKAWVSCSHSQCMFTNNERSLPYADAIVFWVPDRLQSPFMPPVERGHPWQKRVGYIREANQRLRETNYSGIVVDYTMGYHPDLDIPYPFGYTFPYDAAEARPPAVQNHAAGKRKLIAWVASHCDETILPGHKVQSPREEYVHILSRHVNVDLYGKCGRPCDGEFYDTPDSSACYRHISKTYKFYLAFENSICPHYITEKAFRTLTWGLVPIVMGGGDYEKMLPPKSYINVRDFSSPRQLAIFLLKLDKDDDMYNSYFQWKQEYKVSLTGKISKRLLCDVCDLMKDTEKVAPRGIDFIPWFDSLGTCMKSSAFQRQIMKV